jgi:hypothetical protein
MWRLVPLFARKVERQKNGIIILPNIDRNNLGKG